MIAKKPAIAQHVGAVLGANQPLPEIMLDLPPDGSFRLASTCVCHHFRVDMHLRRWILILICVTFVGAPFQRAYSHVLTAGDMLMSVQAQTAEVDTGTHDGMSQHHNHQSDFEANGDQKTAGCCPVDHTSQTGGFCSDCLAVAILNSPAANQTSRILDVSTRRTSNQSVDFTGDTPVPKNSPMR